MGGAFEGDQAHLARRVVGETDAGAGEAYLTNDEELYLEIPTVLSAELEKSKVRVLVRGELQELVGEIQGPVTRTESIYILISIAIHRDLDIFKIDISAAYL